MWTRTTCVEIIKKYILFLFWIKFGILLNSTLVVVYVLVKVWTITLLSCNNNLNGIVSTCKLVVVQINYCKIGNVFCSVEQQILSNKLI